ncbi:cytochrome c biogenesis protein CcdC [Solibacillus sp. MA9]|uniref:Cytochrome c biogenesis protein CcdC n=1 Tax=Solibacillus palustris TaxID=2908203 RepID=A0ABS9UGJ2_9BACL|nr:cytochrome c biogenesis protein CcdC [Solibacillus sp. MA9]MCH7323442.1 cytochrome c biogenesis protein CcdC [Solibacillus sp. MA9]
MFDNIPAYYLLIGTTIMAAAMGTFALFIRIRAQKKPVNAKKILIPPIAMSTGASMFLFEEFRVAPPQILEAVAVGLVFSTILIATSKFEVREGAIYMKQSKAFPFILIGLLIFRIIMKIIFADNFDVGELGGMFFILAFAMLLPWRIGMLIKYKKLEKSQIVS